MYSMRISRTQDPRAARNGARGSEQQTRAAGQTLAGPGPTAPEGQPITQDVRRRGQGQEPMPHELEPIRPGLLRQARGREQPPLDAVAPAPGPGRKRLDLEGKRLDPERRLLTGERDTKGGVPCREETSNEKQ